MTADDVLKAPFETADVPKVPFRASRLLLVEDDRVIGRVLTAALRRDGYDVRWHPTGGAAVRDEEVDVIVGLEAGADDYLLAATR